MHFEKASDSHSFISPNFMSELKLEEIECRRHGYILSGKFLGQGAYAKVYMGHPTASKVSTNAKLRNAVANGVKEIKVAIKIICVDSAPKVYISKFLPREIATMNKCYKHINVLQLYDMFATASRVYLVLELASAGDLLTHINRCCAKNSGHSVPEDSARGLFTEIAAGLRFIHRRGIAHRDLKCENVLLTKEQTIKLCDFGFAIDTNDTVDMLKTHCGSYAYAPPEILRQQRYDGKMADLWSLGIVLFAMVNGGLPFKESDAKAVLEAMKKPVYFKTYLSTECKELIRGLLRIKPQRRLSIDKVLNHPWVTKLRHEEFSLVLKIPTPESHVKCKAEMDVKTDPKYAFMSDPTAVSKYIYHKTKTTNKNQKPCKASLGNNENKAQFKEFTVNQKEETTAPNRTVICKPTKKEIALVPKKTETTDFFKRTTHKHCSRLDEVISLSETGRVKVEKNITVFSLEKEMENCQIFPVKEARPENVKASPATINNSVTPNLNNTMNETLYQRTHVASRADSCSPAQMKTPQPREIASPNVINIRIDQVVDLGSNNYNEFQMVKRKPMTAPGKSRPVKQESIKKTPGKNSANLRQRTRSSKEQTAGRKNKVSPKQTEQSKNDIEQTETVNVVHLPAEPVKDGGGSISTGCLTRKKSRYSKTPSPRRRHHPANKAKVVRQTVMKQMEKKKQTNSTDKKDDRSKVSSQRLNSSSAGQTTSSRYHTTTPSYSKPSQLPCKASTTTAVQDSPFTLRDTDYKFSKLSSPETQVPEGKYPMRSVSKDVIRREAGEWSNLQLKNNYVKSRNGSPTKTVIVDTPGETEENPADACQLQSKYYDNAETEMDAQQLLSYRVKRGHYGHTFVTKERHLCHPGGYGYLVTDDPNYQKHIRMRHSDDSTRWSGEHDDKFVGPASQARKLLYKRAQQPRQTMNTMQQLQQQARHAVRSKRHFLPLPSCGLVSRKSPTHKTSNIFARPEQRVPLSEKKPVLRLNKN